MTAPIPRVLSIAGSDSGGGAGIQADLKAFAACGVHGMTALTAVTAQNTAEVRSVEPVSPAMILAQVRAVRDDIGIDAVKIGMLGDETTVRTVAAALGELDPAIPVVLDPVMVAESGAELLAAAARRALVELLLPAAAVITPNLPEARALVAASRGEPAPGGGGGDEAGGVTVNPGGEDEAAEVAELARHLHELGPRAVVITGGHREQATDVFYDGRRLELLTGSREPVGAGHGSGCTHSSVLAARLAWGDDPLEAARRAREMASRAVRDGLRELGAGAGPVNVLGLGAWSNRREESTLTRARGLT